MTKDIVPSDPAVAAAFARAVGHEGPWAADELRAIERVEITEAKELSALAECGALQHLVLNSCSVSDVAVAAALPRLDTLRIHACTISDLSALARHPSLSTLHLRHTMVSDVSALRGDSKLARLVLEGSPIDDVGWKHLSALASQRRPEAGGALVLSSGDPRCAGYSARLQAGGCPLAVERAANGEDVITQLGVGRATWRGDVLALLRATASGAPPEQVIAQAEQQGVLRRSEESLDGPPAMESGLAQQARSWLQGISAFQRIALQHLLSQFPDQVFYRFPAGDPRFAVVHEHLPEWWAAQMAALAGVLPVRRSLLRFAGFPMCAVDWVSASTYFNWMPAPQPGLPLQCAKYGRLIAVAIAEEGTAALCVARGAPEPQVIYLTQLAGTDSIHIPDSKVAPAFDSFASMLQLTSTVRPFGHADIPALSSD